MGPDAISRRLVMSIVVSVVFASLAAGCARTEVAPLSVTGDSALSTVQDTTRPRTDTGYAVISRADSSELPGPLAGSLPRQVEDYVADVAGFHRFVRSRGWVGRDRPRKCVGDVACDRPGAPLRAWLRVQAIEDAHMVNLNNLPATGVVIGRIMNVGVRRDSVYSIGPGREEWYIVLEPMQGSPDSARQKIAKLSFRGNSDVPQELSVTVVDEPFFACPPHPEPRPRYPEADFRPCSLSTGGATGTTTYSLTARAWMACAHGCCTSNAAY